MRAFNEIDFRTFEQNLWASITFAIENQGKEYILGVETDDFVNYIHETYKLETLSIDIESENISKPQKRIDWAEDRAERGRYQREVYDCTVSYSFSGSGQLFNVQPTTWILSSNEITVNGKTNSVAFSFTIFKQEAELFKKAKQECYHRAFANLDNINSDVVKLSSSLLAKIRSYIEKLKEKYQSENSFFEEINVKVNKDTQSVFTAPTIKRKIIPQPKVPEGKEFSSEPTMSLEMYNDVLKVIYDSGKNMEKKPALYIGKDEEGLRDQFLFVLETRYDGTTATGETFNRSGKADIILKYAPDGSNLFVAECKVWSGPSDYLKAISQLFDRYLTWRDSKVALLFFVPNNDFSKVLKSIKEETKNHPYFVKEVSDRGESSFSYEFHLMQDEEKKVFVEIMAFHYDKK